MRERGLEQRVGPSDVGPDEWRCAVDRAVDVAFGGEVKHGVGPHLAEDRVQRAAVADVRCVVAMAVAGARFGQRVEVAGVGQAVDIRHRPLGFADDVAHDGRADKARAAGD